MHTLLTLAWHGFLQVMAKYALWAMTLAKWRGHSPVKTIDEWCPGIRNRPDNQRTKDSTCDEENNSLVGASKTPTAAQKNEWLPMVMLHLRSVAATDTEADAIDEEVLGDGSDCVARVACTACMAKCARMHTRCRRCVGYHM